MTASPAAEKPNPRSNRSGEPVRRPASERPSERPIPDGRQAFEEQPQTKDAPPATPPEPPGSPFNPHMADAILRAFAPSGPEPAVQGAEAAQGNVSVSDISREIADRILVSDPELSGRQEVRIMLKESVLPGTEIRIRKEGDSVQIQLVTTSNDTFILLSDRKDQLQGHLHSRLGERVSVGLEFNETGAGQGDGRSRQRRNMYDEMESEG